jgi:hypothetical protein
VELTKTTYDTWTELYAKAKLELPAIGSTLFCEKEGQRPYIEYVEEQDMLSLLCSLSIRILDDDNNIIPPYYVLVPTTGDTKGALRILIEQKSKRLWCANSDKISVKGVTIVGHAKSRKSVTASLLF